MKRLVNLALGGNIQLSDVSFSDTGGYSEYEGSISMNITNLDKAKHEGEWENSIYFLDMPDDVIGALQYRILEKQNNDENQILVLHVESLEVREEYRQTRVVKYLLDHFKETIIDQAIENFGKNNVFLEASFANSKLGESLERMTEKMGLKWTTDTSYSDDEVLRDSYFDHQDRADSISILIQSLKDNGFNPENNPGTTKELYVKNKSMKQYIDLINASGSNVTSYIPGVMKDGDLYFGYLSNDNEVPLFRYNIQENNVGFVAYNSDMFVESSFDNKYIDNFKTVFGELNPSISVFSSANSRLLPDAYNKFSSIEELESKMQSIKSTAKLINRLKKS